MSKSLYPTTLFHFTKSKRAFNNIIKSSFFKVSYARETIKGPTSKREFGIPMISFCDIRLSQLEKHTNSYGRFGIGLSKEWAVKNGLNPVVYMSDGCSAFDDYNQQLKRLKKIRLRIKKSLNGNKNSAFTFLNEEYRSVIGIMRYMKNYSGNLERVGKKTKINYIFADEREWRYVPSVKDLNGIPYIVNPSNINNKEKKSKYNEKLDGINLKFNFDDVKYLIVDRQESVEGLINLLNKIGVDKKHYSKIMCSKQINDDL